MFKLNSLAFGLKKSSKLTKYGHLQFSTNNSKSLLKFTPISFRRSPKLPFFFRLSIQQPLQYKNALRFYSTTEDAPPVKYLTEEEEQEIAKIKTSPNLTSNDKEKQLAHFFYLKFRSFSDEKNWIDISKFFLFILQQDVYSSYIFSSMLNIFNEEKQYQLFDQLYQFLKSKGALHTVVCTIALKSYVNRNLIESAETLFLEMKDSKLENNFTYHTILKLYFNNLNLTPSNDPLNSTQLNKNNDVNNNNNNIKPGYHGPYPQNKEKYENDNNFHLFSTKLVNTYYEMVAKEMTDFVSLNIMLEYFLLTQKTGQMESIFQVMMKDQLTDQIHYNKVLNYYYEMKLYDKFRKFYNTMQEKNMISIESTNIMLKCLVNGYKPKTTQHNQNKQKGSITKEMVDEFISTLTEHNSYTLNILINYYSKTDDFQKIVEIYNEARETQQFDNVTMNSILNYYTRIPNVSDSEKLFQKLDNKDKYTYSMMLQLYAKVDNCTKFNDLFQTMIIKKMNDDVTFTIAIHYYVRTLHYSKADAAYNDMKVLNFVRTLNFYKGILKILSKRSSGKDYYFIWRQRMENDNHKPDYQIHEWDKC